MSQNQVEIVRRAKQNFIDIQNDLLGSSFHNFDVNFNLFMNFCETNDIMNTITEPLKESTKVDLEGWWTNIHTTGGSMAGSKRYELPPDPDDQHRCSRNPARRLRTVPGRHDEAVAPHGNDLP